MSCGCGGKCGGNGMMGLGDYYDDTEQGITLDPSYYNPVESPYPVVFTPGYTPAAAPLSAPSPWTNLLASLATGWAGTSQQILKAQSGALPTYQTVGPGGSTTVYGPSTGIPLGSNVSNLLGGNGLLLVGAGLLLFMMMGKK